MGEPSGEFWTLSAGRGFSTQGAARDDDLAWGGGGRRDHRISAPGRGYFYIVVHSGRFYAPRFNTLRGGPISVNPTLATDAAQAARDTTDIPRVRTIICKIILSQSHMLQHPFCKK